MNREDQFVLDVQAATRQIWEGLFKLTALQAEWSARDFTSTLDALITLTDHPTVGELGAVVYDTHDALKAVLAAGHATNLAKVL